MFAVETKLSRGWHVAQVGIVDKEGDRNEKNESPCIFKVEHNTLVFIAWGQDTKISRLCEYSYYTEGKHNLLEVKLAKMHAYILNIGGLY